VSELEADEVAQITLALGPGQTQELSRRTAGQVTNQPGAVRDSTYVFQESWMDRVREGARLVACRSSGRCFLCEEPGGKGDYCAAHRATTASERAMRRAELRAREKTIERLFEDAAPAFARADWTPGPNGGGSAVIDMVDASMSRSASRTRPTPRSDRTAA
jgi:hypothetical protein